MKPNLALHVMVVLVCLGAGRLFAQDASTFERQQRQLDEQLREKLDFQPPPEQRVGVDWGGWFNYEFANFQDNRNHTVTFSRYDGYLWGRAVIDQGHEVYARGRLSFMDFGHGDSPDGNDSDWDGPKVDRLYYLYDLRNATLRKEKKNLDYNAFTEVGRQYVEWGTGLALSMPMDAVIVGGEAGGLEVKGLYGRPIRSWDNIDHSPPVGAGSERDFYAVQATYKGIPNHQPFAYYIFQEDHTPEHPDPADQEFDYDSQYIGLGSRGKLVLQNLYYQTELSFERGSDFGFGSNSHRDPIRGLAYDLMLNYLFQSRCRPTATFEYLFASGDDDRRGSPTDTLGGNRPHTPDEGFNGFGFRNTGLAFAPPISNLQMFRLGGAFRPLPQCRALEEFQLGADMFFYLKAESQGAGPDFNSVGNTLDLGHEVDVYCNWRLTSDLAWTVRYGVFFPGEAYVNTRQARNFLFTGVTLSF